MKTNLLTFAIKGFITVVSLPAIAQEKQGAETTNEGATGIRDLEKVKVDSISDYQKFKIDAEMRITENQINISMLKTRKPNETKEVREKYDQKVLAFEKKNEELKSKIRKSGDTNTTRWTSFKHEFNHDMEELSIAISNMK